MSLVMENFHSPKFAETRDGNALRSFFNFNFCDDESTYSFGDTNTNHDLQYTQIRKSPKYGAAAARQVNQMFKARRAKVSKRKSEACENGKSSSRVASEDSDSSWSFSSAGAPERSKKRRTCSPAGACKKLKAPVEPSITSSTTSTSTWSNSDEGQESCLKCKGSPILCCKKKPKPKSRRKTRRVSRHSRKSVRSDADASGCCHGDLRGRRRSKSKPCVNPRRKAVGSIPESWLMDCPSCCIPANCDLNKIYVTESFAKVIKQRIRSTVCHRIKDQVNGIQMRLFEVQRNFWASYITASECPICRRHSYCGLHSPNPEQ